jgi:hypothetical protein
MKSNRITADQARELAGPSPEEIIENALSQAYHAIRESANGKRRSVRLNTDFWTHGGYKPTPEWKKVKEILENDGFTVKFFYEERQFVDMATIIEW